MASHATDKRIQSLCWSPELTQRPYEDPNVVYHEFGVPEDEHAEDFASVTGNFLRTTQ